MWKNELWGVQKYCLHLQIFPIWVILSKGPFNNYVDKMRGEGVAYLNMVKNIWPHSKNTEHSQKNLSATEIFFELANGLGINRFFFSDCIEDEHWTNYTLFNFKYVWIFLHYERIHRRIPMLYADSYEGWNHWRGLCSILFFGYVSLFDLPSW